MSTGFLLELVNTGRPFFVPGGNVPANGGQLQFFVDNSSTPVTVYKDSGVSVAWTNPILLDSGGCVPLGGEIWLPSGVTVKVIFAPANDTFPAGSPYATWPGLSGINDVSAITGTEWISGPVPTFVSGTSFTVPGDQTLVFTNQRRVKTTNTGGTVYSTVTGVSFGAGITTVTVSNDSSALDAGISAVFYGLFDPSNPSISPDLVNRKGNSVVASATTNIWATNGNEVHVTGSTTISSFGTAPYSGNKRIVIYDSTPIITAGPNLQIPGVPNSSGVIVSAGDKWLVIADTTSQMLTTRFNSPIQLPPDYISGFQLTNNTVSTYTIGTGAGTDSTNQVSIYQTSAVNKSQSSYSFGTNLGGKLHAAAMSSATWYFWFELYRDSDGSGDPGFDVSQIPTLPAGVTKYRYIGSRKTNATSTTWDNFSQHGDEVLWGSPPPLDFTSAPSTANRTLTPMNIPPVRVKWFGHLGAFATGSQTVGVYLSDPLAADVAPGGSATPLNSLAFVWNSGGASVNGVTAQAVCWSNTSSQIGVRGITAIAVQIQTLGWTDSRGKPV